MMKVAYKLALKEEFLKKNENILIREFDLTSLKQQIVLVRNVGLKESPNQSSNGIQIFMVSKTSHYSDISVFTVQSTTCRKTRTLHKTVHLHANSKQMVYDKNIVNNIFLVTYSPSWLKWRVTFLEEYAVINIHPKHTNQNSN